MLKIIYYTIKFQNININNQGNYAFSPHFDYLILHSLLFLLLEELSNTQLFKKYRKNDFAKISKNLATDLDIDLKIILLNHQNIRNHQNICKYHQNRTIKIFVNIKEL